MGIKRYDIETWTEDIKESEDGKWVRYIDVDKIQADNKRLEADITKEKAEYWELEKENSRYEEALEEIIQYPNVSGAVKTIAEQALKKVVK